MSILASNSMRIIACFLLLCSFSATDASRLLAGATGSQWVIVVNAKSPRSRTIANHYAHWRNIPSINIIALEEVPDTPSIYFADFKKKILTPILEEITRRNLLPHIQGIAYSSDFPTAVDLRAEPKPTGEQSEYLLQWGSLNSLTYLYRLSMAEGNAYIAYHNNFYAQANPVNLFGSPIGDQNSESERRKRAYAQAKQYDKLATLFEAELQQFPHQYPLAYAAAQAWAEAGQSAKAIQRLQQAIELGFCYSKFIQEDPRLASLHEYSRFQALVRGCEDEPFDWTPIEGFDARKFYSPNGPSSLSPKAGVSYLLSFVLAVCTPTGNTEEEALRQLKTSVEADYTQPTAPFYFTKTSDVRTKCREAGFQVAVDRLKRLGRTGEIITEAIPQSKTCAGVTMGVADFKWSSTKSKLVPGALGDNLTSLGGAMENPGQTKLTEFLRHGAAAASGTVTEPYAIQAKFPHPTLHATYAAGLTAAEAFYAAVPGPYQLLMAGDPLCQPFANPPRFQVYGLEDRQTIVEKISFELRPPEGDENAPRPKHVALLFDGQFKQLIGYPSRINLVPEQFSTGAHELRFIVTDDSKLEQRAEKSFWVAIGPDYNQVKLTGPESWKKSDGKPLQVEVFGSDSDAVIELHHDQEYLLTVEDGKNTVDVPVDKLGSGPVRLQAIATVGTTVIKSLPITVMIE